MNSGLPTMIGILCKEHGAWVVGSTARKGEVDDKADIDLIVPLQAHNTVMAMIPTNAIRNGLGGYRFRIKDDKHDCLIDLWFQELGDYFTKVCDPWATAWNPTCGVFAKRKPPSKYERKTI